MSKRTLFVVEDEKEQREIIKEMLSDSYNLITASSGLEAIDVFKEHFFDFDLILLDINLTDMNAYDVFKEWEKIAFASIPNIIMVTAYNETSDVIKSFTENMACFHLGKPFSKQQLLEKIKDALSKPFLNHKTYHLNLSLFLEHWLHKRNTKLLNETFFMDKSQDQFPKMTHIETYKSSLQSIAPNLLNTEHLLTLLEDDCGYISPKTSSFNIVATASFSHSFSDLIADLSVSHHIEIKPIETLHPDSPIDIILFNDAPCEKILTVLNNLRSNLFPWDHAFEPKNYKDIIWVSPKSSSRDWIERFIKIGLSYIIEEDHSVETIQTTLEKCFQKRHLIYQLPKLIDKLLQQATSYRIRMQYWTSLQKDQQNEKTLNSLFPDFIHAEKSINFLEIENLNAYLKKELH